MRSTIANAGKGLFSTNGFKSKEWICPYVGEPISGDCLNRRYPGDMTAPYVVQNNAGYKDSACRRGIGAMANAKFNANGTSKHKRFHNAELITRPRQGIWLRSTKNIAPGGEIFVWYGNEYILTHDHETKRSRVNDNRPC
ncbi:MAG: SET domain-containing protein [Cetobacterium sp.]